MPRVGDVMQLLSGTLGVPNTTIQSAPYNAQQNDWVLEANAPRPISAGGTGSTTAAGARTSLGTMGAGDLAASLTKALVVNTDSVVIIDSEAANATKRWLVSDIRTAFGPASHDHTKLVHGPADISFMLGGTPGAGVFYFMNNAIGTVALASITEGGDMTLNSVSANGIYSGGAITAGGAIVGGTTVGAKAAAGNVHFWFYGPAGEDRGVIYTNAAAPGVMNLRTSGQYNFEFNNSGQFKAPGTIYASGAAYQTDGNVIGAIWNSWNGVATGTSSAYSAISARIESRAAAFANDRVKSVAGRKTTGGNSGSNTSWNAPAGAVVTGMVRESGTTGQVQYLTYMYLQVYNVVDGWVGFTG